MEIMECEITPEGERIFHSLFRYEIYENRREGNTCIINGEHVKVMPISKRLRKRFLDYGMPIEELERFGGVE